MMVGECGSGGGDACGLRGKKEGEGFCGASFVIVSACVCVFRDMKKFGLFPLLGLAQLRDHRIQNVAASALFYFAANQVNVKSLNRMRIGPDGNRSISMHVTMRGPACDWAGLCAGVQSAVCGERRSSVDDLHGARGARLCELCV
jgi:hypothetical protein